MNHYSELTKPQKKLIDEMRKGHVLKQSPLGFTQSDDKFTWKVRTDTAFTLLRRGFIIECFHDWEKNIKEYTLNVDIVYPINYNGVY